MATTKTAQKNVAIPYKVEVWNVKDLPDPRDPEVAKVNIRYSDDETDVVESWDVRSLMRTMRRSPQEVMMDADKAPSLHFAKDSKVPTIIDGNRRSLARLLLLEEHGPTETVEVEVYDEGAEDGAKVVSIEKDNTKVPVKVYRDLSDDQIKHLQMEEAGTRLNLNRAEVYTIVCKIFRERPNCPEAVAEDEAGSTNIRSGLGHIKKQDEKGKLPSLHPFFQTCRRAAKMPTFVYSAFIKAINGSAVTTRPNQGELRKLFPFWSDSKTGQGVADLHPGVDRHIETPEELARIVGCRTNGMDDEGNLACAFLAEWAAINAKQGTKGKGTNDAKPLARTEIVALANTVECFPVKQLLLYTVKHPGHTKEALSKLCTELSQEMAQAFRKEHPDIYNGYLKRMSDIQTS